MSASTTQASTRVFKGREGWEAKTIIGMGRDNRVLVITTHKTQGGMVSSHTVNTDTGEGLLSWDLFGDYNKRTVYKGTRCTEKTVRDLHAQALGVSDLHMSDATAFYVAKDAKKVKQAEREAHWLPSSEPLSQMDPMDDSNYVGHPMHY